MNVGARPQRKDANASSELRRRYWCEDPTCPRAGGKDRAGNDAPHAHWFWCGPTWCGYPDRPCAWNLCDESCRGRYKHSHSQRDYSYVPEVGDVGEIVSPKEPRQHHVTEAPSRAQH